MDATGNNDTLTGSIFADTINGGYGNDTIIGNAGNDTLNGGNGNDTYIWNLGDGFDTITDYGLTSDNTKLDKVKFGTDISFEDLSFVRKETNLHIYVNNDKNEGICITNFFYENSNQYYYRINQIELADGTTKDITNVEYTYGETSGNDNITGTFGADTYHYAAGSGLDTITDNGGTDKIKFGEGISINNISFDKSGNDLHIILNNDYTQGVVIKDFYKNNSYRVEALEFADGTTFALNDTSITIANINKTLTGTADDDVLTGGIGNDVISADDGYNDITGGKGNDSITGGYDNDYYYYNLGDGYDLITDNGGRDQIIFGENISSDDLSFRRINDNLQIIINNDAKQGIEIVNFFINNNKIEKLVYANGSSFNLTRGLKLGLFGNGGNITGTSESDTLTGDNYDNALTGNAGDDMLDGSKGNDTLNGGAGNDTYKWSIGHDFDTITDTSGENILKFGPAISYDNLAFERHNADLVIKYNDEDHQGLRIVNFFNENNYVPIKNLQFDDGSVYELIANQIPLVYDNTSATITGHAENNVINASDINNTITTYGGDDIINAGNGDDNISAGHGDDTITGSVGNDNINGGYGNDTYIWNLGDGFDIITDGQGLDKIIFGENIEFNDLFFRRENSDLLININDNRHQGMRLKNFFNITNNDYPIDILQFNDGTQFNLNRDAISLIYSDDSETIEATIHDDVIEAKGGNDTINTYEGDDTIYAGTGNDTVSSGNGDDTIYGQDGNDIINGNSGDDTLIGGTGNDILSGGTGKDTYIWNLGDGFDTITDNDGVDKIKFGENITFDDLTFRKEGTGLLINVNNERFQGILINKYFETGYNIEKMEFADGTVIDLTQTELELVSDTIDTDITGTMYDDVLTGNIKNNNITAGNGDDIITGGAGDDTILAEEGNDTITGGIGNDAINGGYGNDTYIWNLGDGLDTITDVEGVDKISFGENISFEDLTFTQTGNNLYINIKNTPMQGVVITNYFSNEANRVEILHFSDGSEVDLRTNPLVLQGSGTINGTAYNDTLTGSSWNDTIYGGSGNDTIYAGAGQDTVEAGNGNDTIVGGADNDNLLGGLGNDTYVWNLGDGLDTITDSEGDNRILFGENITISNLAFEMHGNDLHILVNNNQTQGLIIKNYLTSDLNKIEYLEFQNGTEIYLPDYEMVFNYAGGNDTISGTYNNDTINVGAGNDTVNGDDGDDIITGGLGNDTLNGGSGRDTYVYAMGDGNDIINETRGNDTILLNSITKEDVSFRQDGKNLIITIANNETITINNFYQDANSKVENIQFTNNPNESLDLATSGLTLEQTDADDTVNATAYNDIIYGNGGHDTINAGEGDDTIIGGLGNDTLNGGAGNDTYIYNIGDGLDTINDIGGSDKIKFGNNISAENLQFEQIGQNLRIYINGLDSEGLSINNQFGNNDSKIETLEFTDGTILNITSAEQLIQSMNTFGKQSAVLTDTSVFSANGNQMCDLACGYELTKK